MSIKMLKVMMNKISIIKVKGLNAKANWFYCWKIEIHGLISELGVKNSLKMPTNRFGGKKQPQIC